jgi:voltage-gated potassium channel
MEKYPLKSILKWDSLLVLAVFLCAFVIPVIPPSWGRTPMQIGFTLILISGVMTMEKRNLRILYLSVAALVMQWVSGGLEWESVEYISKFLSILFFLIVIGSLIREMATAKIVTAQVIMASISGYLLLGIIYSMLVIAIMKRDANAFNIPLEGNGTGDPTVFLSHSSYFGFVTLATLGYGDIVPLKPYTRSLATLICISGQLYIATIIGILIGKFASGNTAENRKNDTPGK